MDLAAVRAGLAQAAAAAAGTSRLNCFGYMPDAITPPAFMVAGVDIDYTSSTFGHGLDELEVICRILVSRADDLSGQQRLDAFLSGGGPNSLRDAIEADGSLGGACSDLVVLRVQGYGQYEHSNGTYLGAELVVRVIGDGN